MTASGHAPLDNSSVQTCSSGRPYPNSADKEYAAPGSPSGRSAPQVGRKLRIWLNNSYVSRAATSAARVAASMRIGTVLVNGGNAAPKVTLSCPQNRTRTRDHARQTRLSMLMLSAAARSLRRLARWCSNLRLALFATRRSSRISPKGAPGPSAPPSILSRSLSGLAELALVSTPGLWYWPAA